MVTGYAVKDANGTILIETVSKTERAAKVNWLVTFGECMIFQHDSDHDIEVLFHQRSLGRGLKVVQVAIHEAE